MGFTVDAFNLAKSQMLSDFNKALADAEALSAVGAEGAIENSAAPTVENTSRIVATSSAGATPATAVALASE